MPTKTSKDASGAIVLIYRDSKTPQKYILGEETEYVTDIKSITKTFRSGAGETLYEAFESPGKIQVATELDKAKAKFASNCDELEKAHGNTLGRITYAEVKNSSKPGKISAKPRYVPSARRDKYGFPKGSYEKTKDTTIEDTAVREVEEELGITLDKARLEDKDTLLATGPKSLYAVYHYKLKDDEYKVAKKALKSKNTGRDAELQSLKFREVPADYRDFFTNQVSKKAFQTTLKTPGGGGKRKRQMKTLKIRRIQNREQ